MNFHVQFKQKKIPLMLSQCKYSYPLRKVINFMVINHLSSFTFKNKTWRQTACLDRSQLQTGHQWAEQASGNSLNMNAKYTTIGCRYQIICEDLFGTYKKKLTSLVVHILFRTQKKMLLCRCLDLLKKNLHNSLNTSFKYFNTSF